jgi:hypothetical protein
LIINRGEAEKFLKALDAETDKFTFQTFDEQGEDKSLVKILHGTLDQHYAKLVELSKAGAGVYVTVNETDLKGRKAENIKRVRYVFVDLDGAPLAPAKQPRPHIIVESSPKRWHAYWRVEGMALEAFKDAQRRQITRLGSDKTIVDLPRVLRLPGFLHQKGKPFKTRVVDIWNGKPYKAVDFMGTPEKKAPKRAKINNQEPIDMVKVNAALEAIPSDDYKVWFECGAGLHQDLGDAKGLPVFDRWSRKSEKYNKRTVEAKWEELEKVTGFHIGTIYHYATEYDPTWNDDKTIAPDATVEDFVSFLPKHDYVYLPTGQHWPAVSVDSQLPKQQIGNKAIKASVWLDRNRQAQAMTWSPGDPELIPDRIARAEGGWIEKPGTTCLNIYKPPVVTAGDPAKAKKWLDHVRRIYPEDADHLLNWFACKVQQPGLKINHGLLVGGEQGIGKDMILKPVRHTVGTWNCYNAAPQDIMGNYNTFIKSVILQIDEARDLGDLKGYDFYEHLKTLTTAPPDILQCHEKYLTAYGVINCTGVIVTTNHRTGGVHLPPGDRRFYVVWSEARKEDFTEAYFNELEAFYVASGYNHVAAYLRTRDISKFNPKAPPPKTTAWHNVVEAMLPKEDAEFAEVLGILEYPPAVTIAQLIKATPSVSFANWLEDRRNAQKIPHRMESCGYASVVDPHSKHNRWRFYTRKGDGSKTQREVAIYAQRKLANPAQVSAARSLLVKLAEVSAY